MEHTTRAHAITTEMNFGEPLPKSMRTYRPLDSKEQNPKKFWQKLKKTFRENEYENTALKISVIL